MSSLAMDGRESARSGSHARLSSVRSTEEEQWVSLIKVQRVRKAYEGGNLGHGECRTIDRVGESTVLVRRGGNVSWLPY